MIHELEVELLKAGRHKLLPSPATRRSLRVQAGLPQRVIAAALGKTVAAVSRYESGSRVPQGETADKYLAILERLKNALSS